MQGGTRPVRACGTQFVCHKVAALERFIDRFGAYISHLVTIADDPRAKSSDRQKMKGYILKWQDSKMLIGCALFLDLLRPAAKHCRRVKCAL